jgi:hypothetical protein
MFMAPTTSIGTELRLWRPSSETASTRVRAEESISKLLASQHVNEEIRSGIDAGKQIGQAVKKKITI